MTRRTKLLLILIGLVTAIAASAAELETIKSAASGVTISVTPQMKPSTAVDFKIVIDTHSQELSDDFLKSVVLIDGAGKRHAPIAWDGAGPGGHHREGVLRFAPLSATSSLELQITRAKEQSPRAFRWQVQ